MCQYTGIWFIHYMLDLHNDLQTVFAMGTELVFQASFSHTVYYDCYWCFVFDNLQV